MIVQSSLLFLNALLQACYRSFSVWGVARVSLFHYAILTVGPPNLPYYPSLVGAGLAAAVVHAVVLFLHRVVVLGGFAGPRLGLQDSMGVLLDWLVEHNDTRENGENTVYLWKVLRDVIRTVYANRAVHPELTVLERLPPHVMGLMMIGLFQHRAATAAAAAAKELNCPGTRVQDGGALRATFTEMAFLANLAYFPEEEIERGLRQRGCQLVLTCLQPTKPSEHRPGHYVAVTSSAGAAGGRRVAYVVVRGTASIEDCITDMMCGPVTLTLARGADTSSSSKSSKSSSSRENASDEYQVHSGMASAAAFLYDRLAPLVAAFAAEGRDVVIVGHSLGAGTAALLATKLVAAGAVTANAVHCYCLAPPPAVDPALAAAGRRYITSLVNGHDIIPRVTPRGFYGLYREFKALVASGDSPLLARFKGWVASGDDVEAPPAEDTPAGQALRRFVPTVPGRVYYLPYGQRELCAVDAAAVERVELSTHVLSDHSLVAYLKALSDVGGGGEG